MKRLAMLVFVGAMFFSISSSHAASVDEKIDGAIVSCLAGMKCPSLDAFSKEEVADRLAKVCENERTKADWLEMIMSNAFRDSDCRLFLSAEVVEGGGEEFFRISVTDWESQFSVDIKRSGEVVCGEKTKISPAVTTACLTPVTEGDYRKLQEELTEEHPAEAESDGLLVALLAEK